MKKTAKVLIFDMQIKYNKNILSLQGNLLKGGVLMTYADIMWKLVEKLLEQQQSMMTNDQNEKQQD